MFASVFSSALSVLIGAVFVFVGGAIYFALAWQVIARRRSVDNQAASPSFGLPEAFLAVALIAFLLFNITASVGRSPIQITSRDLIANVVVTFLIVGFVAAFLKLRGRNIDLLSGLSRISPRRAVSTGVILLLAAWPLIVFSETITQNAFGSGSSKQEIVDLFNSSSTIEQRVLIIILAVVVAPMAEEFLFRFFIYGVVRRYFGVAAGLIFNAALFAAAHTHLPSAVPLFVLGSCFTLAYEWSGSILVSMSMHALFNSIQLVFLAFPELVQQ
jgi:membrane protease YdiL (CAAX protease family)